MRSYTRSLDPQDYTYLNVAPLRKLECDLQQHGVPYRQGQHEHRLWEYASVLQQFDELQISEAARVLDVGSGGSFLPLYLKVVERRPDVSIVDSMAGGDITETTAAQAAHYRVALPVYYLSAENMSSLPSNAWDVTMCISVIEHVAADQHDNALRELCRVTKPGGYIFLTSDYFRDAEQVKQSPWQAWQHTAYTKELVLDLPNRIPVEFVGTTDLDYRGDFVHNYSFCNICLRKRQHPLSGQVAVSTEKAQ